MNVLIYGLHCESYPKLKDIIYKMNEKFKDYSLKIITFGIRYNAFNIQIMKICNQFNIKREHLEYKNEFLVKTNLNILYHRLHTIEYAILINSDSPTYKATINAINRNKIKSYIYEK